MWLFLLFSEFTNIINLLSWLSNGPDLVLFKLNGAPWSQCKNIINIIIPSINKQLDSNSQMNSIGQINFKEQINSNGQINCKFVMDK